MSRLEVTLEKAVEGVTWPHLLKDPEIAERRSHWPLSEGIEDELSPEELQKAKHLLAGLMGPDEVVSVLKCFQMCACVHSYRRTAPARGRVLWYRTC